VDSDARFLFVSKNRVAAVAEEAGGIPFDAPGVELGHHGGKCSFEAILAKYELSDPALERMARVVHAADIAADLHADELAPGLEALATGFGVLFADDEANLQAQFVVYDALYAWCRLNTVNA
jgi:hypothetical protein